MTPRVLASAAGTAAVLSLAVPALAQWTSNAAVNTPIAAKVSAQVQPKVRPTPDGGCYVSWYDSDPNGNPAYGYDVFIQKLDASGTAQWAAPGVRVADLGFSSTQDYGLDVDAQGNALLAFLDDRSPGGVAVTAAEVTPAGTIAWSVQVAPPNSTFKGNPKITATSDGNVIAGWIYNSGLGFQKLSATGAKLWGSNGIAVRAPSGVSFGLADLHGADSGTAIFSFVASKGFSGRFLLANKLSTAGALAWGATHKRVFDGGSLQIGNYPSFVADGAGGAVFAWYQVSPLQSRAQHLRADGSEVFAHNGAIGSFDTSHYQVNPTVSYDAATGETFMFWDEQQPGPTYYYGIYGQKFDAMGAPMWGATGAVVQPLITDAVLTLTSQKTANGCVVSWSSDQGLQQQKMTGARVAADGSVPCLPFAVSTNLGTKTYLDSCVLTGGDFIVVWADGRNDEGDIYGQNINADCTLGQ